MRKPAGKVVVGARPAAPLVIDAVEIVGLDIVPKRRRKMSTGAYIYGDKGGWAGRPVLVGVRAGGLVGWGEVRPINPFVGETAAAIFANLRDFYAPMLVGRNAVEIDAINRDLERRLPANPAAFAAMDMALHDLVGQALGVPVHALLGGACRSEIPLEWSVGLEEEKVMIDEAIAAVERFNVRTVCIKVGPLPRIDIDERVAKAIQKALPGIALGMDANTAFDTASAIRFANRVAGDNLAYYEQPVARDQFSALKRVRDRVNVPIVADESCCTLNDAMRLVAMEAADVLAVKFYKCGGLRRCRDIAVVAEAGGLRANCAGTANGSYIEAIAAAHLCAAVPNHAFGAEFIFGLPSYEEDPLIVGRPVDVTKNGTCNVPTLPGFGFSIDRRFMRRNALAHLIVDARGVRPVLR
jgi:L-alanine-DL-glutamate epimerase-like enolase superfamily enzyme